MKKKTKKFLRHFIVILLVFGYYYLKDINQESYSKQDNPSTKEVDTNLSIHYIDVGQADSILIKNEQHSMLIDAGNNEDGPLLVKYLKEEHNITKLDFIVGTHPHEDHIGGLDDIINNFEVKDIYLPEAMTTTKTFEDVLDAIANSELEITIPEIGEKIKIGELNFEVIYTGNGENGLNESSIILKMTFGNHKYLFTGDTTSEIEKTILTDNIDIDVLKVAHHGSKYSTSKAFLDIATPNYAIISTGEGNSYNHPDKETISRLIEQTNNIYITKDVGTIILTSNGKEIKVNTIKTNTNG